MLTQRFGIFKTIIDASPEVVSDIVTASCALHNFLIMTQKEVDLSGNFDHAGFPDSFSINEEDVEPPW
jgi:hypothetical protein